MTKVEAISRPTNFSARSVTAVIRGIYKDTEKGTRETWLRIVAAKVTNQRPDLAQGLLEILKVSPAEEDVLKGLTIGEMGVCYEALEAQINAESRKTSGQYFTPDDTAKFMASHSRNFERGIWLDPCCGVGNLAWHLANEQNNPGEFVRSSLILIDRDKSALATAVALIASDFLEEGDLKGLKELWERAVGRDYLDCEPLPSHDFVIVNPPYARAAERPGYETGRTRETFAYFMEKVTKHAKGFIAVTPASYVSAPKFQVLRNVIDAGISGGRIYVFDNVPDTLFRGYKFGSANTSKTNFVRAAITVASSKTQSWKITPILRWKSVSRNRMFQKSHLLLSERRNGPNGEWVKIPSGFEKTWDEISRSSRRMSDIIVKEQTPYSLTVATTPRYYISASFRDLSRRSKAVLYFSSEHERNRAAIVLNSSLPYIWWRALDGGVTLPARVLQTVPIPNWVPSDHEILRDLIESEKVSIVTKLNAGLINENIKHPSDIVEALNQIVLPGAIGISAFYSDDMFQDGMVV